MSISLTGLRDTDVLLCSYLDDMSLLKLSHTCKYFYELTADTLWKDRAMVIIGLSYHFQLDSIVSVMTTHPMLSKEYYLTQLYPYKCKFSAVTQWLREKNLIL